MRFQQDKKRNFFLIIFIALTFLFVSISPSLGQDLGNEMMTNVASAAGIGEASLPTIIGRIFKIVLSILGLVALVIIITAGVQWMTSKGDPEKIKKAKALLSAGLIGLLIIISAYAIVSFIISKFGGVTNGGTNPGPGPGPGPSSQEQFRLVRGEANFDPDWNIYRCSNIRAVFNHTVKQDTVDVAIANSTLKVVDADNNIINGTFESAGKSILFTPDNFWTGNANYKLIIPKTIADTSNNYLAGCLVPGFIPAGDCSSSNGTVDWQFSANDELDETPPFVDHAYPVMDEDDPLYPDRNVPRAPMIDVVFNENIDYSDIYTITYDESGNEIWHPKQDNFQLSEMNWTCRQYDGTDSDTCVSQSNSQGDDCFWSPEEKKCVGDEALGVSLAGYDGDQEGCNILCTQQSLSDCYQDNKCAANGSLETWGITTTYNNDNLIIAQISQGFRISVANGEWLKPFTWYEIKVDGVKDMCDNPMDESQLWVFETNNSVPDVYNWWPKGDNVCPDAPIGIRFATSMYEYEVSVEVKNNVSGEVEFEGSIRPSDFSPGSSYKATLTTNNGFIKVLDHNDAPENISKQFKIFRLDLNETLDVNTAYTVTFDTDLVLNLDGDTLGKKWGFDVTTMEDCVCEPLIYQVLPSKGPRKSCVTITGYCFKGTGENSATIEELWFDDQASENPEDGHISVIVIPQSYTDNSITAIIPEEYGDPEADVPDPLGVGVKIIYDNQESVEGFSEDLFLFTVTSNNLAQGPCIWRLLPNEGHVGNRFNIEGIKFGLSSATSSVNMEDWEDDLIYYGAWTPELIEQVMVPGFTTAGDRNVTVTNSSGFVSNPVPFSVIFDRPKVKEFGCNPPPEYSSPSPYKNTEDACTDIVLVVEFDTDMRMDNSLNGVLNSDNYTVQNCGDREEFNPGFCLPPPNDLSIDHIERYSSGSNRIIKIVLSQDELPLDTNTWYQVSIACNVESGEGVAMGETSPADDYTWHFKTRNTNVCPVASIDLFPKNQTLTGCPHTKVFQAYPMASNCNALTPSSYSYNWSSSNTNVATVSAGNSYSNIVTAIDGGSTWIRVEESVSLKWTKEKLDINCCNTNEDCYDPDGDDSNRCEGSICDDTYGICTPVIKSFNPEEGYYNDWVTIQGCWFNNYNPAYSEVRFKEEPSVIPFEKCTSSAWQNEQIIAEVPEMDPFGKIKVTSAPYGGAFVASSDDDFEDYGSSRVGICNLRPSHGIPGSITQLTANDNLSGQGADDDVYYGDEKAIGYPAPGWVYQQGVRSQSPFNMEVGPLNVKVLQNDKYSNSLNFEVDAVSGGPGDECIEGCGDGCNTGFTYCSSPYRCLEETAGDCSDCRCCCDVDNSNACGGNGLICFPGQGDCTGYERGLCCGCQNDEQCSDGGNFGCGFLDPNRCCYTPPEAEELKTCVIPSSNDYTGVNTAFTLIFNKQMDTSRLNNEYIKVSKEGECGDDDGEYIGGRCYINGQIVSTNSDENNTTIFYPHGCKLSEGTEYTIEFVAGKDGNGVRSSKGVSYGLTGTAACTWNEDLKCKAFDKKTSSAFCYFDKVNVEPSAFTVYGLQKTKNFIGLALDIDDNAICVESFDWESEDDDIATVSPASALETTATSVGYGDTVIIAKTQEESCQDVNGCGTLKVKENPLAKDLPQVIEQQGCEICADGGQSPSPYKNSKQNCPNAQIVVRFNHKINENSLTVNSNIILEKKENGNKWGSVNIGSENVQILTDDSATTLYIKNTLSSSSYYKMTLKSGEDGIKDLDDLPLDGNKNMFADGTPNDDYVWEFETGSDNCDLNKICISPGETIQLNHPNTQNYYVDVYASNCNYLVAEDFNNYYEWEFENQDPAQPNTDVAEFQSSIDEWEATVGSLDLGETDIKASVVSTNPEISDSVHLIVATNPDIESVFPENGAENVCRNTVITAKFNQIMDDATISSDTVEFWGEYDNAQPGLDCTGCVGGGTSFEDLYNKNVFTRLYHKLKNIFTKNVSAQASGCWCKFPINVSSHIAEDDKTVVSIEKGLLAPNLAHKVIIKSGVQTKYGLELDSDYNWTFTSKELCELSEIQIIPKNVYFNVAGDLEEVEAHAYDDQGNEIFGVPGYNWDWQWASDNSAVVDVNGTPSPDSSQAEITSKNQEGLSQITATATLKIGIPPEAGSSVVGQAQVQVSFCEHPWIYKDLDSDENTKDTNFRLFYCRDNDPLLPRLLLKEQGVIPSNCGDGTIQDYEACDGYEGTPVHATCLFDCSGWVCDDGYYKEGEECVTKWPSAPSELLAELDEVDPAHQINLSWNDNSFNEDGFSIERKTTEEDWSEIGTVGSDAVFYNNSGLNQATTYYYKVRAFNIDEDGETYYYSPYCNEASKTTSCLEGWCYKDGECYEEEACAFGTTQKCFNGNWINMCGNGVWDSGCNEACDGLAWDPDNQPGDNMHCSDDCLSWECDTGYGDCNEDESDGCETYLSTNDDCGSCDAKCSGFKKSCNFGICKCDDGWGDCDENADDCETDLLSDNNCGRCGNVCPEDYLCCDYNCIESKFATKFPTINEAWELRDYQTHITIGTSTATYHTAGPGENENSILIIRDANEPFPGFCTKCACDPESASCNPTSSSCGSENCWPYTYPYAGQCEWIPSGATGTVTGCYGPCCEFASTSSYYPPYFVEEGDEFPSQYGGYRNRVMWGCITYDISDFDFEIGKTYNLIFYYKGHMGGDPNRDYINGVICYKIGNCGQRRTCSACTSSVYYDSATNTCVDPDVGCCKPDVVVNRSNTDTDCGKCMAASDNDEEYCKSEYNINTGTCNDPNIGCCKPDCMVPGDPETDPNGDPSADPENDCGRCRFGHYPHQTEVYTSTSTARLFVGTEAAENWQRYSSEFIFNEDMAKIVDSSGHQKLELGISTHYASTGTAGTELYIDDIQFKCCP